MRPLDSLAALNIVLSWLPSSGEVLTLPEILSPRPRSTPYFTSGPTSAAAYRSPSGAEPAYFTVVSTPSSISHATSGSSGVSRSTLRISSSLGSISPTAAPLLASSTSSSSPQPASTSGSHDDPSTMTHTPSPVAMVAGCLAGSIVIVVVLLVFFVARRRNRRRRRMLHEVMNQSWAARLAARHSVVGGVGSKDEEVAGTTFSRNTRRLSRAPSISRSRLTISTSKKSSRSDHHPFPSSKTGYSSRHARPSLETDNLELSSRRKSTSLCLSSSASATLPPPTIIVPLPEEPDTSKPGDEPGMPHALTSSSASRPVSRSPSANLSRTCASASPPFSQSGDWIAHARNEVAALSSSNDLTPPTSTSSPTPSASQGAAATTMGGHADETVGVDFATAEGEKRRWKLGLGRRDKSMDVGLKEHPSAAVRDRGTYHELEIVRVDDVPPAYEDVR